MRDDSLDPALQRTLLEAMALLEAGAASAESPFHVQTLATLGLDGAPRQRSVVVRGFDAAARAVEIHTDTRSGKYAELKRAPAAALHGWDDGRRVQLRLSGRVACHDGDAVARAAWDRLPARTRTTYCVSPGPGTAIEAADAVETLDEASAFPFFAMLRFGFHALEWLHLEHGRYARARFRWEDKGCIAMWLVP